MLRSAPFSAIRLYEVEVSGWDCTERFFVERCELEWDEESSKQVELKRALGENTCFSCAFCKTVTPAVPIRLSTKQNG